MSEPNRIGVFYSIRHRFEDVLKNIRRQYPNARLTAIVPKDYPVSEVERRFVDAVVETEYARYSPRKPAAMKRLMAMVKDQNYDLFIVLYTSIRHRLIAGASHAKRCECWSIDGRTLPLHNSVLPALWAATTIYLWGQWSYLRIWLNVYLRSVRPRRRRPS